MKTRNPEGGKKVVEDQCSSASTTNSTCTSSIPPLRKTTNFTKKGGPSKTWSSLPKKRKTGMRKKLRELSSMVPRIAKDTKDAQLLQANWIIGEAALYAIELQMRARMLRAQMERMEVSKDGKPELDRLCQTVHERVKSDSASKSVSKMEVVRVGERGLVKLVCSKGKGVAVSLYEALESLTTGCDVESSILNTVAESFELKFTLNVGKSVKLEDLKLSVAGAFHNQGFDFIAAPQP